MHAIQPLLWHHLPSLRVAALVVPPQKASARAGCENVLNAVTREEDIGTEHRDEKGAAPETNRVRGALEPAMADPKFVRDESSEGSDVDRWAAAITEEGKAGSGRSALVCVDKAEMGA